MRTADCVVAARQRIGDLQRFSPCLHPLTAGRGSSRSRKRQLLNNHEVAFNRSQNQFTCIFIIIYDLNIFLSRADANAESERPVKEAPRLLNRCCFQHQGQLLAAGTTKQPVGLTHRVCQSAGHIMARSNEGSDSMQKKKKIVSFSITAWCNIAAVEDYERESQRIHD